MLHLHYTVHLDGKVGIVFVFCIYFAQLEVQFALVLIKLIEYGYKVASGMQILQK